VRQANGTGEWWCMAKAKKTKPREHLIRWRVSLITATPAKLVDFTMAPDAARPKSRWRKRTTSAMSCDTVSLRSATNCK